MEQIATVVFGANVVTEGQRNMLLCKNEVLNYKNDALIQRYEKDYSDNQLSGEQALHHLMQYFWLSQKHLIDLQDRPEDPALQFECCMYNEMNEIDDMWHTFLLFTHEYADFSMRYFGTFIHHVPTPASQSHDPAVFETKLTKFLSYTYDHLGEKTVRTWFAQLLS